MYTRGLTSPRAAARRAFDRKRRARWCKGVRGLLSAVRQYFNQLSGCCFRCLLSCLSSKWRVRFPRTALSKWPNASWVSILGFVGVLVLTSTFLGCLIWWMLSFYSPTARASSPFTPASSGEASSFIDLRKRLSPEPSSNYGNGAAISGAFKKLLFGIYHFFSPLFTDPVGSLSNLVRQAYDTGAIPVPEEVRDPQTPIRDFQRLYSDIVKQISDDIDQDDRSSAVGSDDEMSRWPSPSERKGFRLRMLLGWDGRDGQIEFQASFKNLLEDSSTLALGSMHGQQHLEGFRNPFVWRGRPIYSRLLSLRLRSEEYSLSLPWKLQELAQHDRRDDSLKWRFAVSQLPRIFTPSVLH
ncbi:unnamed protein product, partial [Amoebophrya sp. A25]|eukprot:GSA25T00011084001.1